MGATTTKLLFSGQIYNLLCDTLPVKIASAHVSFYTNNTKVPNFEMWCFCCKWAKCYKLWNLFYF